MHFFIFLILSLGLFLSHHQSLNGREKIQDDDALSGTFDIKWLGKISTGKDLNQEKGFFKKVFEFVAGEDFSGLVKPVNLIALDTSTFIVADQGVQFPVLINKSSGRIDYIKDNEEYYPSLVGICNGKDGKIYFTDSKNNKIYVLNSDDDEPKVLNDSLVLNQPTGIAYSNVNDEIWVSETANHLIVVLDSKGNVKRMTGKRGTAPGEFNFPTYIWIDSNDKVYVVDAMNFRIQILSNNGDVLSVFGETGNATGFLASPKGIATDSYGHIYVVDALFHTVQIFDDKGNFLYYFGRQGSGDGEFWMPSGIYIDKYDRIYVADSYNSRIQIFQLLKREKNEK